MLRRFSEYCRLYAGLGYLGLICLLWGLPAIVLHPLLPARWGHPLGRWAAMRGFQSYLIFLRCIGACRFDLSELDALRDEKQGLILAPNHPSLLDAVMVISKFPDVACIMKSGLMDNIFLGGGARLARYIRNDPPLSMIRQATQALEQGSFLLIFPEGTRTVLPPLNPCKPSIGLLAKRAQVPVQTLLIETDTAFLGKGWPLFKCPPMPMTYRIRLGKRFSAPQADVKGFTTEVETYLRGAVAQADMQPPNASPIEAIPALEFRERSPYA
ncbi:MAG: 1-acyl-sn-glycerol-3-phosphate acyltransferase [Verrucomicrobiaceae bacterium]|nr:1-acyl-sn-glycerol-3-phosphate acyltransferase [Verrucomicrobiaceae bacterium]